MEDNSVKESRGQPKNGALAGKMKRISEGTGLKKSISGNGSGGSMITIFKNQKGYTSGYDIRGVERCLF